MDRSIRFSAKKEPNQLKRSNFDFKRFLGRGAVLVLVGVRSWLSGRFRAIYELCFSFT